MLLVVFQLPNTEHHYRTFPTIAFNPQFHSARTEPTDLEKVARIPSVKSGFSMFRLSAQDSSIHSSQTHRAIHPSSGKERPSSVSKFYFCALRSKPKLPHPSFRRAASSQQPANSAFVRHGNKPPLCRAAPLRGFSGFNRLPSSHPARRT